MAFAPTPEPPYYAAIFTTKRSVDDTGYPEMAQRMFELAERQSGYLGFETAIGAGSGIAVSYWADEKSIGAWKQNAEHLEAQRLGQEHWYDAYVLRVAKVERAYSYER